MLKWHGNNPWKVAMAAVVFADAMGAWNIIATWPNSHGKGAALALATIAVWLQMRLARDNR